MEQSGYVCVCQLLALFLTTFHAISNQIKIPENFQNKMKKLEYNHRSFDLSHCSSRDLVRSVYDCQNSDCVKKVFFSSWCYNPIKHVEYYLKSCLVF